MNFIKWIMSVLFIGIGMTTACTQSSSASSELLGAINSLRAEGCECPSGWKAPVEAVKYQPLLTKSSSAHAEDLQYMRRLSHYSSDGENIGERVNKIGYEYEVIGENLAFGQRSVPEVMRDWIKSDSHCRLLMDGRFQEVGYVYDRPFWVLHFGTPKEEG